MSYSDQRSRVWRGASLRLFRLLGGGLFAFMALSSASAGVQDTGVFELDGNAATTGAVDDFDTIYSGPGLSFDHSFTSDTETSDLTFHGGANDDRDPISDWECVDSPNPQGVKDLYHAYTAAYMVDGDLHFFFGADREANSGNSWVGFWLFQQPVQCQSTGANTPFSGHKTDGDLFIVSKFRDDSTPSMEVQVYRWTDPDSDPDNGNEFLGNGTTTGTPLVSGIDCSLSGSPNLCGIVNTVTIAAAWEGASLGEKRYFEGGVNLSALFRMAAFPRPVCYTSYLAETRGGLALSSQPFDYTTGAIDTCASLTVDLTTDPSNDAQQFNFAVAGGPDGINDAFQLADTTTPHTTFDLKPGSYMMTETIPSVWDLTNIACVGGPFGGGGAYVNGAALALNFGDHVTCTFNNLKKRGTLTVDKVALPSGDSQLFDFAIAGAVNDSFQLADATASHTTAGLLPGAYSITEGAVSGWDISNISCTGGPFGAGGTYTNGAAINVDWGDAISCIFTNAKRGSITVDKVTAPVGDLQTFDFILNGGPDSIHDVFQLTDTATAHATANLRPGTYTLTETAQAGWDFASATCTGGPFGAGGPLTNGGSFSLTPGAHISCTVTNVRRSRVTVDVVTTPSNNLKIFKFVLSGKPTAGGKAVRFPFELTDAVTPFSVELQPGLYKIVQRAASGWKLSGIFCTGGPFGGGNPYLSKNKFTLNPTEQVMCTFSNVPK